MNSTEKIQNAKEEASEVLPANGFEIDNTTAIVITDPQIDFLSPDGVSWGAVGESVKENNTVQNIHTLFELGAKHELHIFVSPHYYYEHDHKWCFEGTLEQLMHNISMFDRGDQLNLEGFEGSGADWMPQYKKFINDKDKVTVVGPHKVFGPQTNDLVLQLRKQKVDKVILAGMSGSLCVEAHMRHLLETGFEVAVVGDATASAKLPGINGDLAAQINYSLIASHVFTTSQLAEVLSK